MTNAKWFKTTSSKPKGVVLVAHGLNLIPSRMDQLSEFLRDNGFDVLRLALSGHNGNLSDFKKVTLESWEQEFLEGYRLVQARAVENSYPCYFIGFSMGGALGLDVINSKAGKTNFSKMILLAPAIAINRLSQISLFFKIFGSGFCLPGLTPKGYRASPRTPVGAYSALFQAGKIIKRSRFLKSNIPTLVFIDPKDEFVRFRGIKEIIAVNGLSQWKLIPVKKHKRQSVQKYHHLIIDEESLGKPLWDEVSRAIVLHLS